MILLEDGPQLARVKRPWVAWGIAALLLITTASLAPIAYVSMAGGMGHRWRKDGKELYYRAPDGKVMAVQVTAGTVFQPGTSKLLFQASLVQGFGMQGLALPLWDVSSDSNKFLLRGLSAETTQKPFTVILNWQAGLRE